MSDNIKFITLEGVEGAGKSTLMDCIASELLKAGHKIIKTREPGGTKTGELIRNILLDKTNRALSDQTELLLMFAARRQHIDEVIRPALQAGNIVLCDRFTDASYAYQGGGRGIQTEKIAELENWVQEGLQPDLTILFDLDVVIGLRRAGKRGDADRFEQEEIAFFERIRQCYLERAKAEPDRIKIIDASANFEKVKEQLLLVLKKCGLC